MDIFKFDKGVEIVGKFFEALVSLPWQFYVGLAAFFVCISLIVLIDGIHRRNDYEDR